MFKNYILFLVSEIVLVDDASEHLHLQKKLEDYVSALPILVKIIRDLNIFLFTWGYYQWINEHGICSLKY